MADPVNPRGSRQMPVQVPEQMRVNSRKVFGPEKETVFINSAEFSGIGMEIFMDVGIVPVESMNQAIKSHNEDPKNIPSVDFHVSHRFGMSIQSAVLIHQRLTQLIQQSARMFGDFIQEQPPSDPPTER